MSDNDIRISFTRDEVQTMVEGYRFPAEIRAKFEAALPPEYPEGTVAWVTTSHERRDTPDRTILCAFRDGQWRIGDTKVVPVGDVHKVEPLRVLANDEIAVKRRGWTASEVNIRYLRESAHALPNSSAQVLDDFADALDAEVKP